MHVLLTPTCLLATFGPTEQEPKRTPKRLSKPWGVMADQLLRSCCVYPVLFCLILVLGLRSEGVPVLARPFPDVAG